MGCIIDVLISSIKQSNAQRSCQDCTLELFRESVIGACSVIFFITLILNLTSKETTDNGTELGGFLSFERPMKLGRSCRQLSAFSVNDVHV